MQSVTCPARSAELRETLQAERGQMGMSLLLVVL